MIWNSKHDSKLTSLAYNANIQTAFHWFKSSKAFNNTRNHRTYAQVLKTSDFDHRGKYAAKHGTSGPRIVTVNNKKVKPKIVTPSKVSINAKGCTSLKKSSSHRWETSNRDSPNAQHQGFLANRFNILMDLNDDSSSDRYTDTEGSEGEVQPFIDTIVPLYTQNAHNRSIYGDQKSSKVIPQHEHGSKNNDSLLYDIKASRLLWIHCLMAPPHIPMTLNKWPLCLLIRHKNMYLGMKNPIFLYIYSKFPYTYGKINILGSCGLYSSKWWGFWVYPVE